MKEVVESFDAGNEALNRFLDSNEKGALLAASLASRRGDLKPSEVALLDDIIANSTNRKQYVYSVAIVSLYGLLERVVDSLVEGYVHRLASLVTAFTDLPAQIVKNHTPFSIELMKLGGLNSEVQHLIA